MKKRLKVVKIEYAPGAQKSEKKDDKKDVRVVNIHLDACVAG
jgi:hypothetical protein